MKRRPHEPNETEVAASGLADVLARLDTAQAVAAFLEDLCTPAELEAMASRSVRMHSPPCISQHRIIWRP